MPFASTDCTFDDPVGADTTVPLDRKRIVAAVCTRNRGASLVPTLASIFANSHPSFAVIVVDQSDGDDAQNAAEVFFSHPNLTYVRSPPLGKGSALNRVLWYAEKHWGADLVAFTDDDCTVPPDWIETIETTFVLHPQAAVVFSNVIAADYDRSAGFIPAYVRPDEALITTVWQKCRARGIGAGLSVRASVVVQLGGFDELLGPGARFPACEDGDIALRALLAGHSIVETNKVSVVHYGFRTWDEGRALSLRDWVAIGAAYMKPLRAGRPQALIVFLYEFLAIATWPTVKQLLSFKRPQGAARIIGFVRGAFSSFAIPIDRKTLRFRVSQHADASQFIFVTPKRSATASYPTSNEEKHWP